MYIRISKYIYDYISKYTRVCIGIYISDNIDVDLVDWNKSLCNTRYKKTKKEI